MWADYEDRITTFLAAEAGTDPAPRLRLRLQAAQLIATSRTLTAPELRALVAGLSPEQAVAALERGWPKQMQPRYAPSARPPGGIRVICLAHSWAAA
jgi:hypothetical protein